MPYTVAYTKEAVKSLRRMPASLARSIRSKMEQIAEDPYASHPNVTKLQNREGFRLRVGDWRIINDIDHEKVLVLVLKVGSRSEVYR